MDIDEDEDYVTYNFKTSFKGIRIIDKQLLNTEWILSCDVQIIEEIDNDFNSKFNLILSKIQYWFSNIVNNSLFINNANPWKDVFMTEDCLEKNNIVLIPDDPTDDRIALVFQSKMNAIGQDICLFTGMNIQSDNSKGISFTFYGDSSSHLPENISWYKNDVETEESPWWDRNSGETYDSDNVIAIDFGFLDKFYQKSSPILNNSSKGTVIKFKPKLVKTDDDA